MRTVIVKRDRYFDSVFLMQVTAGLEGREGIDQAHVAMGTPQNLELLRGLGFIEGLDGVGPNDLLIAVEAGSSSSIDELGDAVEGLLAAPSGRRGVGARHRPSSIGAAKAGLPEANLAIISVPGDYAVHEARKALDEGLHVMLFSDNVSVEDEVALKRVGVEQGLLVMGPDCGTAIINGVPLCFANEVRRGNVGIVAASGTGAQEVSVLIDRSGGGCSQVIGTGGRDLKASVGGLTTLQAIDALSKDPATQVIVVISKPPDCEVSAQVLKVLAECGKPSVIHFIGSKPDSPAESIQIARTLEEAARLAVSLSAEVPTAAVSWLWSDDQIAQVVAREVEGVASSQKYLRGYFTGGTLCDEALFILREEGFRVHSNLHPDDDDCLSDPAKSHEHTVVDLGDDVFTRGRPHPMIEPQTRNERIDSETIDETVAVVMIDVVLGHGSHQDPAGAVLPVVKRFRERVRDRGGRLPILACVVGTERDPQRLGEQRRVLEAEGVVVAPSNATMARVAGEILGKLGV